MVKIVPGPIGFVPLRSCGETMLVCDNCRAIGPSRPTEAEAVQRAKEFGWSPAVLHIGGEPTLTYYFCPRCAPEFV